MDNRTKAATLVAQLTSGQIAPVTLEAFLHAAYDQIDVYRYALNLACGGEDWPRNLTPESLCACGMEDCIETAQDELRHGRRPEWLDQ